MAIVNNAIGNAGVQTALQNSDFIVLDEYPEDRIARSYGSFVLNFSEFPLVSAPIYIPCISTQGLAHFLKVKSQSEAWVRRPRGMLSVRPSLRAGESASWC